MIRAYLNYLWNAQNAHDLHSPFVYDFYHTVFKSKEHYYEWAEIEELRSSLLINKKEIEVTDFGAGSKSKKGEKRKIKNIASRSAKKPVLTQMLFRIIQKFGYQDILELGTSLGITTAYLSKANPAASITSLEGCSNIALEALKNIETLKAANVSVVIGNIDQTLNEALNRHKKIDFAFLDANHRYEATLRYYEQILPHVHENSCLVFDDIYWSSEMTEAWQEIKAHSHVKISIDIFDMGFVFFRKGIAKQHFMLK